MKRWAWVALVALAVLPYLRAVSSPLLYDDRTLLDNRWLVHDAGLVSVFEHHYWYGTKHADSDLYRPLTVLSLAWNMRAMPTKEGIRTINVAAHALAVLVLFSMLISIVRRDAAWIGAELFAVHPLASEAVLWAVGRAEIFAAIFGLVAFVLFTKLRDEDGYGSRRLLLSVGSFLVALCFKESAATWLAIGAAWVLLAPSGHRASGRLLSVRALFYLVAFAAFYALRGAAVGWGHIPPPFVDNPLVAVDPATRAVNAVILFVRYVGKMAWPGTLSVEYGFNQLPVIPLLPWGALAAAVVIAAFAALVIVLYRRGNRVAAFLTAFVPAAFAVTGNLAFPIGTIFGERLAYTPLLGACGLAGWALAAIGKPKVRAIAAGLLLAALSARTFARGGDFRDLSKLSEATAAASPQAVKALANAGRVRLRRGDAAGAVPLLTRAVAIWPDYAGAWRLLADAYAAQGDEARAAAARERAAAASAKAPPGDEPL
jgi:hypothetical protein